MHLRSSEWGIPQTRIKLCKYGGFIISTKLSIRSGVPVFAPLGAPVFAPLRFQFSAVTENRHRLNGAPLPVLWEVELWLNLIRRFCLLGRYLPSHAQQTIELRHSHNSYFGIREEQPLFNRMRSFWDTTSVLAPIEELNRVGNSAGTLQEEYSLGGMYSALQDRSKKGLHLKWSSWGIPQLEYTD